MGGNRIGKYIFCVLIGLLLFCPLKSYGQKLEDYLLEAAQNNPELRALFNEYLAAYELAPQVSSIPDPKLFFGYFILPIETRNGSTQLRFILFQQFPWFGLLKMKKSVALFNAEAKYKDFKNTKNKVFFRVRENYYRLYEVEEKIRITKEILELHYFLEKLAERKYETGQVSLVDVLRVQLQIRDFKIQLKTFEDKRLPLQVSFNNLLFRNPKDSIHLPSPFFLSEIDQTALLDSIYNRNLGLKRVDFLTESALSQQKVARRSLWPTIGIGISFYSVKRIEGFRAVAAGREILLPFLELNLPIYGGKYKALKQEADYRLEVINQQEDSLRNFLANAYEFTVFDLKTARRNITWYKQQIEQGKQAVTLLLREYSASGKDFEEVLRMHLQVFGYELALIQEEVKNNIAVAKLIQLASLD
ncbi:TolC family protein [Xanthovirga aplysinae]|uniref:TolC family protein n=1 Tax=Xanthovirga aplysinae TaxID=2529853 RepID=UPI0012BB8D3E|nr:TolC family protein [Xanthovirga aplysinae]MTI30346.1 TolC family protein [Xanthovirga aplysinae]